MSDSRDKYSGKAADIWALGITLYCFIFGKVSGFTGSLSYTVHWHLIRVKTRKKYENLRNVYSNEQSTSGNENLFLVLTGSIWWHKQDGPLWEDQNWRVIVIIICSEWLNLLIYFDVACSWEVGAPYNGLYGRAPLERGTVFSLKVYKRTRITQVEVYERVGKYSI